MTAIAIVIVLALAFAGVTLHHAIAVAALRFDRHDASAEDPSERELLLLGTLPGFAIVGTLGTYLAIFQLLEPVTLAAVLAGLVVWRWRDAVASLGALRSLLADIAESIRSLDVVAIVAVIFGLFLLAAFLLNAQIPFDNRDITVFHIPLARSMVEHHGFVYPQIPVLFFSYNPLFFNLLFAETMLYVNHAIAPAILGIVVFFAYVGALSTFYSRTTAAFGVLLTLFILGYSSFFSVLVPTQMIEIERVCFGALGLLFGCRYLQHARLYDIVGAGLIFGASIGGHYLELVPLALLSIHLISRLRLGRTVWIHAAVFVSVLTLVAGYWYLRNWIVMGNPIWPLLFGHHGFNEADYASFVEASTTPIHAGDRTYSNNLLTIAGWRDMIVVIYSWFLTIVPGMLSVAVIAVSVTVGRARIGILIWWTAALFFIWFALMFHHRWAWLSFMMLCTTAIISAAPLMERILSLRGEVLKDNPRAFRWLNAAIATGFVILIGAAASIRISTHGFAALPTWISPVAARAVVSGNGIESYLARSEPGYLIYREIAQRDLRMVFQPFDDDNNRRAGAFNDYRTKNWLIWYTVLPASLDDLPAFLRKNDVHYFIDQPSPLADPPLNPQHVAYARQIIEMLKPHSKLLLTDPAQWSLYEIADFTLKK